MSESRQKIRAELGTLSRLAAPMILAQVTQMGMGVADTIMAGQVSAVDLAGVALGGNFYWPFILLLSGIIMSLTPSVSQLHGAGREREAVDPVDPGLGDQRPVGHALDFLARAGDVSGDQGISIRHHQVNDPFDVQHVFEKGNLGNRAWNAV